MTPKASRVGIGGIALAAIAAAFVLPHEGLRTQTYADPIGIPTVCAGETGPHVQYGQSYTVEQCMAMLDTRLQAMWAQVEQCIERPLETHQAMAVLSWTYNVGVGAACRSTLMKMLNRGEPPSVWCGQLSRWTYAKGKQWPGLVTRRADERALCEGRA